MRRLAVLLVAMFLVNLPFVHETLTEREIAGSGKTVSARVLEARTISGRHFVDYRLPESADPAGTRFSARLDASTYSLAKRSRKLSVRAVPGKPEANRPAGEVSSPLFLVIALGADVLLALGAVVLWRRRRSWLLHEVLAVEEDSVRLRRGQLEFTTTAPGPWLERIRAGQQVPGSLRLVADGDLVPGPAAGPSSGSPNGSRTGSQGLEQVAGPAYVVRGRVVDATAREVVLEVGEGITVSIDPGRHRIRADIRDFAEVPGTLCFTPS